MEAESAEGNAIARFPQAIPDRRERARPGTERFVRELNSHRDLKRGGQAGHRLLYFPGLGASRIDEGLSGADRPVSGTARDPPRGFRPRHHYRLNVDSIIIIIIIITIIMIMLISMITTTTTTTAATTTTTTTATTMKGHQKGVEQKGVFEHRQLNFVCVCVNPPQASEWCIPCE